MFGFDLKKSLVTLKQSMITLGNKCRCKKKGRKQLKRRRLTVWNGINSYGEWNKVSVCDRERGRESVRGGEGDEDK